MAYKTEQDFKYKGKDWWEWAIWIEASEEELDEIKYVEYTLHPTFYKPVRDIYERSTKFRLDTSGWGVFTIYVTVFLKNGEKNIKLEHELVLRYPDGKRTFK